eukprot:m.127668 g.127668  ORF g.127668 m.127668 type:complete len:67 (+) comp15806_c0_seq6:892-1092(+)
MAIFYWQLTWVGASSSSTMLTFVGLCLSQYLPSCLYAQLRGTCADLATQATSKSTWTNHNGVQTEI